MITTVLLVIASRSEFYDVILRDYWCVLINHINRTEKYSNYKIFLVFGKTYGIFPELDSIKENIILAPYPEEMIPGILNKTLYAMEFIKNIKYDLLIRTNVSSFWILDKLTIQLNNLLKTNPDFYKGHLYDGPVKPTHERRKCRGSFFINGAAIYLSKTSVDYILDNLDKLIYNYIDDVALGHLLNWIKSNNNFSRYTVLDRISINSTKKLYNLKFSNQYHIRIANHLYSNNNRLYYYSTYYQYLIQIFYPNSIIKDKPLTIIKDTINIYNNIYTNNIYFTKNVRYMIDIIDLYTLITDKLQVLNFDSKGNKQINLKLIIESPSNYITICIPENYKLIITFSKKFKLNKCIYGTDMVNYNVTNILNKQNNCIKLFNIYNKLFGDPFKNTKKKLKITFFNDVKQINMKVTFNKYLYLY